MDIIVYDEGKRCNVKAGDLVNGVFVKQATSKHYMVKLKAYGVQEAILRKLDELGCETVAIQTQRKTLFSALKQWFSPQAVIGNFGHGAQRFLPVAVMEEAR